MPENNEMTEMNELNEHDALNADAPNAKGTSEDVSDSPATSRRNFLATAGAGVAGLAGLMISSDAVAIENGTIEPTEAQAAAFAALPFEGPITMLNLLKFAPDGGLAKYMEYGAATGPLLQKVGGKAIFAAQGKHLLIGDQDWDMIFIVEYPEKNAMLQMIGSPEYQTIAHLRHGALESSVLLAMKQMPMPTG